MTVTSLVTVTIDSGVALSQSLMVVVMYTGPEEVAFGARVGMLDDIMLEETGLTAEALAEFP